MLFRSNKISYVKNTITLNELEDGTYNNCVISVIDDYGNHSDNLSIGSFTIDTTPPEFNSISIVSSNSKDQQKAKPGDNVSLSFMVEEVLPSMPTVTIFGININPVKHDNYSAFFTLTDNHSDNVSVPFSVTIYDAAGNQGKITDTTDNSSVIFDKTAPEIINISATSKFVKPDDNATIQFKTSEPIQVPVVSLAGKNAVVTGSGLEWSASRLLDNTSSEGDRKSVV